MIDLLSEETMERYINILNKELVPALGCTEPIAIAYAAATARDTLGCMPESLLAECSGNIVKNVKSVVIPGTQDMHGIEAAAILGALGGDAARKLEVLTTLTSDHIQQAKQLLARGICQVKLIPSVPGLVIRLHAFYGKHHALVEISGNHTHITKIERDKEILLAIQPADLGSVQEDIPEMSIQEILNFADTVPLQRINDLLLCQAKYNMKIAEEGLRRPYGASVGQSLLRTYGNDVKTRARAYAAAGSDARMNGCQMPVIINSGSGNQGITVSLPVVVYAQHLKASEEELVRALAVSNLISIHIKSGIGTLSAYCGAVSAACGCGAAISYLHHCPYEVTAQTVTNILGSVSGIVCDGAKSSCAAKIAAAVDAAILSFSMASNGHVFLPGEGLVKDSIEDTIHAICEMGRDGMQETDLTILQLMIS